MNEAPLTAKNAVAAADAFIAGIQPYPGGFRGRGIVIPGGGPTYFTNAWVCIHILRSRGCHLPIQLWHLGPREMDDPMRELLKPLGVECIDALEVRKQFPARILNGWELKPYAILHCPFEEVLLLDADNVAVMNPEFLFETPEYNEAGAVFWPDFGRMPASRSIWSVCGVPYQDEPEFESGQIVVNKRVCWAAMTLAMWYNEQSDFFYQHFHGDKETFHMAFRRLKHSYAMPARPIEALESTMCQHDFAGRRIFQHRNMDKWKLFGENKAVAGFLFEKECNEFLAALRRRINGRLLGVRWFHGESKSEQDRALAEKLTQQRFVYRRVGYDERPMTFLTNGHVGEGAAGYEVFWDLRHESDYVLLELYSADALTCTLTWDKKGRWLGRWIINEQMPIEIFPEQAAALDLDGDCFPRLGERAEGFRKMREMIHRAAANAKSFVMVETGCIRKYNDWHGDGNSTRILDTIAGEIGARLITVDIKPEHCALAAKLCRHATVICGDSVAELYRLRVSIPQIDFLYLDSYDLDWSNPHPSAFHHIKELCAASSLLKKGAMVFVDDNQGDAGKGMYVKDYMRSIGAIVIHDSYQIGFVMP